MSLSGCTSLYQATVPGEGFNHFIASHDIDVGQAEVRDRLTGTHHSQALHIYLTGDGVPFVSPDRVALDPTPRKPLVLELMKADPAPSLMLGRPCYHVDRDNPDCRPELWTTHRYAPQVVRSLVSAVNHMSGDRQVVLIGYSGGGTLAMLMAPKITNVTAVITVAANLDTRAWAAHHGYTPLVGSLNPADTLDQTNNIAQYHFVGGSDDNVPAALTGALEPQLPSASIRIVEEFGHTCCWRQSWPVLLAEALAALTAGD